MSEKAGKESQSSLRPLRLPKVGVGGVTTTLQYSAQEQNNMGSSSLNHTSTVTLRGSMRIDLKHQN